MILTRHARERLAKRLSKRKKLNRMYSELWAFLDRSVKLSSREGVVIFTDGRKSLVCVELPCEVLSLEEIVERVKEIDETYTCVFFDERLVLETVPRKFVERIPGGRYCFYIKFEKRSLYVGTERPLLAVTIRPAKRGEREKVT